MSTPNCQRSPSIRSVQDFTVKGDDVVALAGGVGRAVAKEVAPLAIAWTLIEGTATDGLEIVDGMDLVWVKGRIVAGCVTPRVTAVAGCGKNQGGQQEEA